MLYSRPTASVSSQDVHITLPFIHLMDTIIITAILRRRVHLADILVTV